MHEFGIMESAIKEVSTIALHHGAKRVHRVVIRIGTLSGVEPSSLQFAFEAVTHGTVAENAKLELQIVEARAHCSQCGTDFETKSPALLSCPKCSQLSFDIRGGQELELCQIEMSKT